MRIGVIGGGAWGTALAQVAASGGDPVQLWAREHDVVTSINREHQNRLFLPDIMLSPAITATDSLADLSNCDALLVVTPAQHLRQVLNDAQVDARALVLCAKGIENGTAALMSEIAQSVHPRASVAVLSGPSFAAEVARGLPTAVTLACADKSVGRALAERLVRPHFRPYVSDDVVGAEIGGAVKNVLAIACGVVAGANLGENARAALIARGFAEMVRYGVARGGRAETLGGLSGLGDLVLTCSSVASRNFSLGMGLGRGESAESLLSDRASVAEGAFTAPVLAISAKQLGVAMPVVDAVCALLSGEAKVDAVIAQLMARPLTSER
jgi:glycerol-3-phosphate dehydrogenase (NAD(P)+)